MSLLDFYFIHYPYFTSFSFSFRSNFELQFLLKYKFNFT